MIYFLLGITLIVFLTHTSLRYIDSLHMFQQNLYDTKRYFTWCIEHSNKSFPFFDILPLLFLSIMLVYPSERTIMLVLLLTAIFYFIGSLFLYRKRKRFVKKPLVITARALRLMITSLLLFVVFFLVLAFAFLQFFSLRMIGLMCSYILLNVGIYLLVWFAGLINMPLEYVIRQKYIREANAKITAMKDHLTIVGITGSYGKTTTKNIVKHVLNEKFYPLMTPASYNTPMGITRTIRELLKPIHNVFIAEMGAYKVGDIKELTAITHPNYGIITAIGPQHLNTFKTIEQVQRAKFELVEALGKKGVAILNYDDPLIRSYQIKNKCQVLTYGIESEDVSYRAKNVRFDATGIQFTAVFPDKQEHDFALPLLGEHNVLNALAALALATHLGESVEQIRQGFLTLQQIEHRLELKSAGTYTIIDDAFNANPIGTKKAIDVLTKMPGKRIVLTPGMIELGKEADRLNEEYGAYMADKIDFAILVGEKQTAPILRGLETKMSRKNIFVARDLPEALEKMRLEASAGSFVLIANDLPDSYNE